MSAQDTPGPNWVKLNPAAVATCSPRHIQSVLEDAQRDILSLAEALQMAEFHALNHGKPEEIHQLNAAIAKATGATP